jgi:hypothetical protein
MTLVNEPEVASGDDADVAPITTGALAADDAGRLGGAAPPPEPTATEELERPPLATQLRPALAAALSTSAAGLVVGGIFGSWFARGVGVFAALLGAGWALFAARARRPTTVQAAFPVVLLVVSALALVGAPGGPSELPALVGDAIDAGRVIRPPVPFDPGWRVLVLGVIGVIGFGASAIALGGRSKLGMLLPLPLVGLASVTQPESEQFVAGVSAFVPVLAAIGVLFGGDTSSTETLDRGFEVRRLLRALLAAVPLVGLLFLFNNADFLFPEPAFDPDDKPQKPRAQPLSAADDRVLFEVGKDASFTGPWRVGALDVYEDDSWLIPGFNRDRLVDVPADGQISTIRGSATQEKVTVTVRDLGDTSVLPILGGTTRVVSDRDLLFDPRMEAVRVPTGRVPGGLTYEMHLPQYATADELEAVDAEPGAELADQLAVPDPPATVERLLAEAPPNPWKRLDFLRQALLDNVTASGSGSPIPVPTDRVVDLITGKDPGTPFEIVAAEALLARWAGVPSRIGFGFDGVGIEGEKLTVRPRNSAQWLEVWFEGYGWVPLIGAPKKAEASLDSDPNARFDPGIQPSDDVAVDVYYVYELEDLTELYQRVRDAILRLLPFIVLLAVVMIGWPVAAKAHRRSRRRRWAAARGPRQQVVVEYAEFRDLAIDLGVGDIYDTPLEYLFKVRDDAEHRELAWLASRAIFGDMIETVSAEDALAAEELAASVRRRLASGQPLQVRLLAYISRASLEQPYTEEIPTMTHLIRGRVPGLARLARLRDRIRRRRRRPTPRRLAGDPR